jgi:predicted ArsR family transcriptional regulator
VGTEAPVPAASSPVPLPQASDALAGVLHDERRRQIYQYVTQSHRSVTVNEVADRFDIHRNAAKHHLDRLLDAGLLRAEFRRINGRRGPGAGRPSKLYSAGDVEVSFSLPERHYDLLAHLVLQALTRGDDLEDVGLRFGRDLAAAARGEEADGLSGVGVVLDRLGFKSHIDTDPDGCTWITTENCPFGWVAAQGDGEVCRLDRAIVAGVLEGFGCGSTEVRGHSSMLAGQDVCVREARVRT